MPLFTGDPVSTIMLRRQNRRIPMSPRTQLRERKAHVIGASLLAFSMLTIGGPASATQTAVGSPEPVTTSPAPALAASPAPVTAVEDILVEVHRAPNCGCCSGWEAYMQEQGFAVDSWEDPALSEFKVSSGVPSTAMSCHTAIVDGYIVEGHVPVAAVFDLLAQRPEIDGIALPGMPAGSPGMPGENTDPFEVLAFVDGITTVFGEY